MQPKTILFDVDGVLGDLRKASVEYLRRHLRNPGYQLPHLERFTDGLDERLLETLGLYWASHGFASRLEPYLDALEAVRRLQALNHFQSLAEDQRRLDLVILTAHWDAPTWVFDRAEWLRRHFGIPHGAQIHTHRKELISGDWLVEDSSEYAEAWLLRNPQGKVAYINRYGTPPKRPIEGHPRVVVLHDLRSLPETILS
jgi:hypothetical protein